MNIAKRVFFLFLSLTLFSWAFACSDSGTSHRPLEQELLNYKKVDMVKFTISGNAVCSKCEEEELPIDAMQLEVYPAEGSLDRFAYRLYDGLGNFSIPDISAAQGQVLEIQGRLLREGTSGYVTAYHGYAEVVAPNDDGDVVAITLKFPSSQQEQEAEEEEAGEE